MTWSARAAVLSACVFSITACSSAEWRHPVKPSDEFAQDYNKCQNDAMRDPKLQQGLQLLVIQATERCVQKMGWRLVEKE
ncbi:MAG TPA: hypothetical protein VFQ34_01135 [Nitrospiraceae bacterium]|jgi:hypothetical protein|nr:hypothetical protein [Nitrospiraceae bacterium]